MITHSFLIRNLDQINEALGWCSNSFGRVVKYDIKPRYSIFSYDMQIKFNDEQELTLFLLKFGDR